MRGHELGANFPGRNPYSPRGSGRRKFCPAWPARERRRLLHSLPYSVTAIIGCSFRDSLVSLMGTWITNVAQGWLVYSLTHSPLLLGLTSFAGQVPVFFFSALGGMIADRFDRRRVLHW